MKKLLLFLLSALLLTAWAQKGTSNNNIANRRLALTPPVSISPDSAKAIARDAWIYAFPLFNNYRSMYLYALDKKYPDYAGGFNKFKHYAKSFTAADTAVITPNNDTPYSWGILNLSDEPVILEVPDVPNRYYSFQFIDLYTFNFAYVGSRTTGSKAGKYLIAGPNWAGTKPAGVNSVIRSETNLVTLLGRTELKMAKGDIENVKKLQDGYKLVPLHVYTHQPAPSHKVYALPFPGINQAAWGNASFIGQLNNLLQYASRNPTEKSMMARFGEIGIAPGKKFDSNAYKPEVLAAITAGARAGAKELKDGTDKLTNATDLFGTRQMLNGNYLKRALGAAAGLFGNTKDEAIYIGTRTDKSGAFLTGKTNYVIRFPKGQTPPDKYFWSITLYELPSRFLVNNPINRYSIGDRTTGLKTDANGDLSIYIQHDPPNGKTSNWLPSPKGAFYYLIRIYGPDKSILDGTWKAPQPETVQ
ncbi:DUF1254 domain-containing protein [Mucilaginibacter jinjuensis]|uniref:DUF1254 domain-containing protein n=1 Tax=Mucilaginibacter jinjuensis TaxID=1176721 RepID=A0ABY7T821_9SPHI|nr:DUF1254 domain-containing protein [Mucilaginibacter jinjuensis]WCT12280.1 DUF1254 domain-containing protein [Mucilaginibacter jinjuensis]